MKKRKLWLVIVTAVLIVPFGWCVAALAAYIYSGAVVFGLDLAGDPRGELPIELVEREAALRAAQYGVGVEVWKALPFAGIQDWLPGGSGELIPEEMRSKALKFADSAEGRAFFARNLELIEVYRRIAAEGKFDPRVTLNYLNCYRSSARLCVARAALAYERGKTAEILPALEPAETLEQAICDHETTVIECLVRYAITAMRIRMAVGCGPETPAHAQYYRALQARLLGRSAQLRCEPWYLCGELKRIRNFGRGNLTYPPDKGAAAVLIAYPLACFDLTNKLRRSLEFERRSVEYASSGVIPEAEGADDRGSALANGMKRSLSCRAAYATALALKAYRCENGVYPETLDALVPEYLEKLFPDPCTGGSLDYRKLPDGSFELAIPGVKLTVASRPRY